MKSSASQFCVLLTATIAPVVSENLRLVRHDPTVRRRDYEEALRSWLNLDAPWIAGVVFAENSGADLQSLRAIAACENPWGIPVEFVSCNECVPPTGLHYGYNEMLLVCRAVRDSRLLSSCDYFIKATGRYRFPDICRLVRSLPENFSVALDSKHSKFWSRDRHFLTHFALAVFRRGFFQQHLLDLPSRMIPAPPWTRAQFIETMLFDRLQELRCHPGVILRWRVNCEPQGVGANGDDYGSARRKLQRILRSCCRRVLPWFWI